MVWGGGGGGGQCYSITKCTLHVCGDDSNVMGSMVAGMFPLNGDHFDVRKEKHMHFDFDRNAQVHQTPDTFPARCVWVALSGICVSMEICLNNKLQLINTCPLRSS